MSSSEKLLRPDLSKNSGGASQSGSPTNTNNTEKGWERLKERGRQGWSHPTLQAVGINRIRLPSRNWTIFWVISGSVLGISWWDNRERRRIRQYWKDQVSPLAKVSMSALELPRKVQVYLAAPPNDFVDVTLKHFRRYVKPILTAAAIDYEVIDESRQGHIRTVVAERIRDLRRINEGKSPILPQPDELDREISARLHYDNTGGVICIGRGAYKEYISGLHEGWMGSLEEPKEIREAIIKHEQEKVKEVATEVVLAAEAANPVVEELAKAEALAEARDVKPNTIQADRHEVDSSAGKPGENNSEIPHAPELVTPCWLRPEQYSQAEPCDLFYTTRQQPVAAMPLPHLLGILNTPWRIWRVFNRRHLANEYGKMTAAVVFAHTRPAVPSDINQTISDEADWPRKFKQQGLDKDSEWMRPFALDERILNRLEFYEYKGCEHNSEHR